MSERALIIEATVTFAIWAVIAVFLPELPTIAALAVAILLGYLVVRGGPRGLRLLRHRRENSADPVAEERRE